MTEPMDDLQWADKLDKIAAAIAQTLYEHTTEISKHNSGRKIMHDDEDYLRTLAKDLRVREYTRLLAEAEAAR
jgi:hypothetical protein